MPSEAPCCLKQWKTLNVPIGNQTSNLQFIEFDSLFWFIWFQCSIGLLPVNAGQMPVKITWASVLARLPLTSASLFQNVYEGHPSHWRGVSASCKLKWPVGTGEITLAISASFKLNPQRNERRESCIFRVDTAKDILKLSDLLLEMTSRQHPGDTA